MLSYGRMGAPSSFQNCIIPEVTLLPFNLQRAGSVSSNAHGSRLYLLLFKCPIDSQVDRMLVPEVVLS